MNSSETAPSSVAVPEPASTPSENGPVSAGVSSGALFLLAGDLALRKEWSHHLHRLGYRIVEMAESDELLAQAETGEPALIVLDFGSSVAESSLLERLRSAGRFNETPILFLADAGDLDLATNSLRADLDDCLPKPVHLPLLAARIAQLMERKRLRDESRLYLQAIEREKRRSEALIHGVIPIGLKMLSERNFDQILELIMLEAMSFTNADGGGVYICTDDGHLKFMIMRTLSLGTNMGGTSGVPIPFPPMPLHENGQPNLRYTVTACANRGCTIVIKDVYTEEGYDFTGPKEMDQKTGNRTTSVLNVPLKNSLGQVIGILQLLNALDRETGRIIPFHPEVVTVVEALASLAAGALDVYAREQKLKEQVQLLRVEIDEAKKTRQVAEIVETDYFQHLQQRASKLRRAAGYTSSPATETDPRE